LKLQCGSLKVIAELDQQRTTGRENVMSDGVMQLETPTTVEAVIISGPRKGEFITLPPTFDELSPEVEAALTALIAAANRMAESAREATAEARALLLALRGAGGEQ
jgi:hypothetical protein